MRTPIVAGVVLALVMGLSACAVGRDAVSGKEENLAKQRELAVDFLRVQGGVENIRFTREGGKSGLGAAWSVNAVVTIEGLRYQMIFSELMFGGDPLPDVPPDSGPRRTTVVFSDGSSGVIH